MRNRDENKEIAIREKAIELIVNEGFDGLSMQKLAKKVNISASTIYIYFKNREDLINQLYIGAEEIFEREVLANFDPSMSFEQGLWLQWQNRFRFITKYTMHSYFMEQFRNSPLIKRDIRKESNFQSIMHQFITTAIAKKEVKKLSFEVYWSLAYGPFYTLVRFHLDRNSMNGSPFSLDEQTMKQTFNAVMKSLRP